MCTHTIHIPGSGPYVCLDELSGRYVMSSMEMLEAASDKLTTMLIADGDVTLNDFYQLIDLPPLRFGDEVGWNEIKPLRIRFGAYISTEGQPAIEFSFECKPVSGKAMLR